MGIVELLKTARAQAKITNEELQEKTGISESQASKVERYKAGLSLERVDKWVEACGFHLVLAPNEEPQDLVELAALPVEHRQLLIRIGRLLPELISPHLSTLQNLVEHWEQEGTQPLSRRDEMRQERLIKSS